MAEQGVEVGRGYIAIDADARAAVAKVGQQANAGLSTVGKTSGKRFSGAFGLALKAGIAGAVAAAGAVAVKGLGSVLQAGGELQQSVGGVGAVFKGNADIIEKQSKRAASSVGLSRNAFNELATTLGATLKNKGVKGYTQATTDLIGLGGDLAAQFGGSSKQAVEALSSALRGESDPIEKYGVSLNESAVSAELARRGQDKLKGAALEQAKTQARLALIFNQTKDAQGAFGRESDTLAGKQQRAAAQWENLKAKIGTAFLPIATKAIGFVADRMLPAFDRLITLLTSGGAGIGGFGERIRAVLGPLAPAFQGLVSAGRGLAAVVLPIIRQIAAAFLKQWPAIRPTVVSIFTTVRGIVVDVMGIIRKVISSVTTIIRLIWSRWGGHITTIATTVFRTIFKIISGAMKIVGGVVKLVLGLITGDWKKAGQGIKQIASGLKTIVVAIFKLLGTLLKTIVGSLLSWIVGRFRAWDASVTRIVQGWRTKAIATIRDLSSKVRTFIGDMLDKVRDRFRTGVNAIGRAWDNLKDKAKAPIKFVVETVINKGLIGAFNKIAAIIPGVGSLPNVSVGFASGGWTGPGSKYQPAGIVHADEYVINKASRQRIESDMPGLLDTLNGYASGGLVGGSGRFTSTFANVLMQAQKMLGLTFRIFQRGFRPATSYSGTSHRGDAVDLGPVSAKVVAVLRALGVAAWRRGPAQGMTPHIHGVPLPGRGFPQGSGIWQVRDYLAGGDGLGGRDYEARGGVLGKLGAFLKSGFASFIDWFKDLVKDPLAKLKSITGSPLGRLAAGAPRMLFEGMQKKIGSFAGGTPYAPPGWALVGERGPELAHFGGGERVLSNRQSAAAMGGGPTIVQHFPTTATPEAAYAAAGGRVVAALASMGI